jgi:hypothetical protein
MISYNEGAPHQFRTGNDLAKAQRTRSISDENATNSTKPNFILPLITVWLQVRDLPGPPYRPPLFDLIEFFALKSPPTHSDVPSQEHSARFSRLLVGLIVKFLH